MSRQISALRAKNCLDFVYSNIDKLNARLKALGYNTTFEMKLNSEQKDFDFVNDFVDKRYTEKIRHRSMF